MEFEYQRRAESVKAERRRWWKDFWDRSGTIALWVAAAVGLLAIIASRIDSAHQLAAIDSQITQMQVQTRVMGAQLGEMQAEQRPWVSLTKRIALEKLYVDHVNHEVDAQMSIPLKNTGKNPATAVYVTGEMGFLQEIPHKSFEAWQKAVCDEAPTALGFDVFPDSIEPVFQMTINGKWPLRAGGSTPWPMTIPYIVTCVEYTDTVSHIRHYTPMIFRVLELSPKGRACCAVFLKHLPEQGKKLALQPWLIGNLPPT